MAKYFDATGVNNPEPHVETETYYARIDENGNTIRQPLRV
jgi:hypothetical protein